MIEGILMKILDVGQALDERLVVGDGVKNGLHQPACRAQPELLVTALAGERLFEMGYSQEKYTGRVFLGFWSQIGGRHLLQSDVNQPPLLFLGGQGLKGLNGLLIAPPQENHETLEVVFGSIFFAAEPPQLFLPEFFEDELEKMVVGKTVLR